MKTLGREESRRGDLNPRPADYESNQKDATDTMVIGGSRNFKGKREPGGEMLPGNTPLIDRPTLQLLYIMTEGRGFKTGVVGTDHAERSRGRTCEGRRMVERYKPRKNLMAEHDRKEV